jgi:ubiquitin-protein ligase
VTFPGDYPYNVPVFKIEQSYKFFHPNISSSTGYICEKTIQKNEAHIYVRDRIDAIVNLLAIPNPDSPLNTTAAALYNHNYREYYQKAFSIFNGF